MISSVLEERLAIEGAVLKKLTSSLDERGFFM